MASEEEAQIDAVLNQFAQQIVEGMMPVCVLYADIQTRELKQQLAQARALLERWKKASEKWTSFDWATELMVETDDFLAGKKETSDGE